MPSGTRSVRVGAAGRPPSRLLDVTEGLSGGATPVRHIARRGRGGKGGPPPALPAPGWGGAPAVTPPPGRFGVQIAAPRSEADARALIDAMRAKYASLLGREWATIHRVELPN